MCSLHSSIPWFSERGWNADLYSEFTALPASVPLSEISLHLKKYCFYDIRKFKLEDLNFDSNPQDLFYNRIKLKFVIRLTIKLQYLLFIWRGEYLPSNAHSNNWKPIKIRKPIKLDLFAKPGFKQWNPGLGFFLKNPVFYMVTANQTSVKRGTYLHWMPHVFQSYPGRQTLQTLCENLATKTLHFKNWFCKNYKSLFRGRTVY